MYSFGNFSAFFFGPPLETMKKRCLKKLKFCEVSENSKSSICWKFQLSISKTLETSQKWHPYLRILFPFVISHNCFSFHMALYQLPHPWLLMINSIAKVILWFFYHGSMKYDLPGTCVYFLKVRRVWVSYGSCECLLCFLYEGKCSFNW